MNRTFRNTIKSGEIYPGKLDCIHDYRYASDETRERNYAQSRVADYLMAISGNTDKAAVILRGCIVSYNGNGTISISEGEVCHIDEENEYRYIFFPGGTFSIPSEYSTGEPVFIRLKYEPIYFGETQKHYRGEQYHRILIDSYVGNSSAALLFSSVAEGVILDKFTFNGTTYSKQTGRTKNYRLYNEDSLTPIGTIIDHAPGYCLSDGTFITVAVEVSDNWQLCNGDEYVNPNSPFFGEGHFTPNLTNDVFLMGSNVAGLRGGKNSYSLTTDNLPPHIHSITHDHGNHQHGGRTGYVSADHSHGIGDPGHSHTYDHCWWATNNAAGSNRTGIVNESAIASGGSGTGIWTGGISANHYHDFATDWRNIAFTGNSGNGGFANTAIENRPIYFSTLKYQRVA